MGISSGCFSSGFSQGINTEKPKDTVQIHISLRIVIDSEDSFLRTKMYLFKSDLDVTLMEIGKFGFANCRVVGFNTSNWRGRKMLRELPDSTMRSLLDVMLQRFSLLRVLHFMVFLKCVSTSGTLDGVLVQTFTLNSAINLAHSILTFASTAESI